MASVVATEKGVEDREDTGTDTDDKEEEEMVGPPRGDVDEVEVVDIDDEDSEEAEEKDPRE